MVPYTSTTQLWKRTLNDPLHHPYHSQVLYNQAIAAGIATDAYIQDLEINTLGTAV